VTKRGVSPLIATVLLIAFAVALSAVVINYTRAPLPGSSTECDVPLVVHVLGGKDQLCIGGQVTTNLFTNLFSGVACFTFTGFNANYVRTMFLDRGVSSGHN